MNDSEITNLLFVRDPDSLSDLAVVFGHHEPCVSAQRVTHAAALLLAGLTPRLLLSGGVTDRGDRSEAESMAAIARDLGVPDDALLLEPHSRTTVENLTRSVALLAGEDLLATIRTVHLVSCPWHMRRVSHLARLAFGPAVRLISSPHDEGCTAATWAASSECRRRVLAEYRLVRALLGHRAVEDTGGADGRERKPAPAVIGHLPSTSLDDRR